jgi:4-diphosphocytidyl-2-C-methyl-D-erythritol kinase
MGLPDDIALARPVTVPMRLAAPAKLNLSLTVTGRRADGFHQLDSEFVLLDLEDRLLLLPGCSGLRLEGSAAAGVPVDASNLAWRGLVAGLGDVPDLACLSLDKSIPTSSGLGGGSSDAAAAWRLGRAWRGIADDPPHADVASLAAIGADVPFFAACVAAARVTGIGEVVTPVEARRRHVVLLHPGFGLSTRAVFAELRRDEWGRHANDLLPAASRLRPELDDIMDRVRTAGGDPRLTGSGPTVFSITDDQERARWLATALQGTGLRVTLTATRTEASTIERIEEEEEPA